MIGALVRNPRFWRDMFFDAVRENRRLQQLVETQRAEITLLTQRRVDFDLSADEAPMLCRRQAG